VSADLVARAFQAIQRADSPIAGLISCQPVVQDGIRRPDGQGKQIDRRHERRVYRLAGKHR
jgi:hypothetical protein